MKSKHHKLPEHALGAAPIHQFSFRSAGQRRKIYLQAGLHADELPGMLVLHYLKRLLSQAERRDELQSEIILVPLANPPGLAQVLLNGGVGRFDLVSGRNFNRDFPDLALLLQNHDFTASEPLQPQVRAAMRTVLQAMTEGSEVTSCGGNCCYWPVMPM